MIKWLGQSTHNQELVGSNYAIQWGMFAVILKRKRKSKRTSIATKHLQHQKCFVFSRELIRGTEVSTFVLITSFIQSSDVLKYFSRCTSSLIIVCEEESANRIATDKDSTFSSTIAVKGIDLLQQNINWQNCDSPINFFCSQ